MKSSAPCGTVYRRAASLLRSLPWVSLLALTAGGCVSNRPWTVRIEPGPSAPPDLGQSDPATHLSVTTFNVWGLPPWINGASRSRHARIADRLRELGSDIVLLQEVWTHQSDAVLSQHRDGKTCGWWSAAARRKGGFLAQNGLLTLSRYPIEGAEFRPFSVARLPDSFVHKGALKVTLAIPPEQKINVWNVHLQDGAAGRTRSRQIAELVQWIDTSDDGQIADIVGGDFNFTPASAEFRRFVAAVGPTVHQLARTQPLPSWDGLKTTTAAGEAIMRPSAPNAATTHHAAANAGRSGRSRLRLRAQPSRHPASPPHLWQSTLRPSAPVRRRAEGRSRRVHGPIPADFTLNRPTRSGRLPPHEKASSYSFVTPAAPPAPAGRRPMPPQRRRPGRRPTLARAVERGACCTIPGNQPPLPGCPPAVASPFLRLQTNEQ